MATLWTAFLWGLGGSVGVAFGAIAYMLMREGIAKLVGVTDKILSFNQKSLDALVRRNELTVDAINQLERIADAAEEKADPAIRT